MRIGGLQKLSLIDYPGKLACVIFTQGCHFRCGYCHNPELVLPESFCPLIPEDEVLVFLYKRQPYLDGVVVSGGEPTIQGDLISFLGKIKRLGYLIKLDTNGSQPHVLKEIINLRLVDYIAMDVKATLDRYEEVINVKFPVEKISGSIEIIINSGIKHEIRTTVVKSLCSFNDLRKIRSMVQGAQSYRIQKVRIDEKILDQRMMTEEEYEEGEFYRLKEIFERKPLQ